MIPAHLAHMIARQHSPAAGDDDRIAEGVSHAPAGGPVVPHTSPEASLTARNWDTSSNRQPVCSRCGTHGHTVEAVAPTPSQLISGACPWPACIRCGCANFDDHVSDLCAECNDDEQDCTACCGTGCRLGPDGCNGLHHPFIGCSTCIACRGAGVPIPPRPH